MASPSVLPRLIVFLPRSFHHQAPASPAHGLDHPGRTIAASIIARTSGARRASSAMVLMPPLARAGSIPNGVSSGEDRPWNSLSEKIPQPSQLNGVVSRQDRANQIRLRRGVDFIQMMLRFRLRHKSSDALVESAIDDQVGTRAKGGADALLVDWWPFSKRGGSTEINSGIGHS
jgi:hypothetical protein